MRRRIHSSLVATLIIGSASIAGAQPPGGGPGGRGGFGGPEGDMMRMLPIMAALDADEDGEISAGEIEKSIAALKSLDKNEDGKLTQDELRPEFGRGGPGGDRGRGGAEGRGAEGRGAEGGGVGGSGDMVSRLMALDKNHDGKLAKDEVEGRLQAIFERADADKDGFATKEEIEKLAGSSAERAGPQAGGLGEGGRGPGGPGPGGEGRGGEGRGGPSGEGRGGFGGPPSPEQFVNRAFEFDADKDGKLSKEELTKMFSEVGPMGGGRGEGRPGGGERGPGARPSRPAGDN